MHLQPTRLAAVACVAGLAVGAAACGSEQSSPIAPKVERLSIQSAHNPNAPATVWAVGDGADGSPPAKRLAQRIARDQPDRFLYLGDVYEAGSATEFRKNYTPLYGRLASVTAPTPGNHEWLSRNGGYNRYFAAADGSAPPPWYRIRIGGWQVISLNSEAPHDAGSPQLQWLNRTLRSSPRGCTLAFWHRPLRSAGIHGDQTDMAPIWNALRGRAQLVLNGHDHDLQRFRMRDGMTQLVIGAGGDNLYPINARDHRLAFGDDRHQGALRMRLRPGSARLNIVTSQGQVLDRSSVRCPRRG